MVGKPEGERIRALEVTQESQTKDIDQILSAVQDLSETLSEVSQNFARARGFFSGVCFSFGILGGCFAVAFEKIINHFSHT
jgi:hypothetical protein